MEVGPPLGFLDQPRGVVKQVDIDVLLTVGTQAHKISEQVGDAHILAIRYEVFRDIGCLTYPIRVLVNHVFVLPD